MTSLVICQPLETGAEGPLFLLGGAGSALGGGYPMCHLSAGIPVSRQVYARARGRQAPMNHLLFHVVILAGSRGPVSFSVWFLSIP